MSAQEAIQPRLLALEQQYTPEYLKLQEQGIGYGTQAMGRLLGQAQGVSAGLQSNFLGMQAPLYGQVGQAAQGAYRQTLDPQAMGLYNSMMQSAQSDLSAGRNLTPQMQKLAQQAARQAMAARGLSGNQAVAQEVLNTYQLQDAREARARQFAGSMYDAGTAQANTAMSMYGQPLMTQMAGYSPASLVQGGAGMYGSMGSKLFEPESQYNASLVTANRQEQMQAQLANAQSRAGLTSGLMGMAGALGGAFLGNPGLFAGATTASNLGQNLTSQFTNTGNGAGLNLGNYNLMGGGAGIRNVTSPAMYTFSK
jgi:hypothetical protein